MRGWFLHVLMLLVVLLMLTVVVLMLVTDARASDGMMGVGGLMGTDSANAGPPPETFYLTNDAGDKLTDDAGTNRITTQ